MRTAIFLIAALALALTAHAEPCKTQGDAEAKELAFDVNDEKTLRGMHFAFRFGLEPEEFPESEIRAMKSPCSRGVFPLASGTLELFGENDDLPPRWALAPVPQSPIMFVALMPRPEPARAWADGDQKSEDGSVSFKPEDMMYAVVLGGRRADKRLIFHFFDKLPDDERLKSLMRSIGEGKARWQVGFDVDTRVVTPNLP
jgi:hypothetical protein